MSEDVSRRKALSLLGLGAALGFTLSSALEPLEAEAQEAAPGTPAPAAPAATGTHGMQRRSARRTHSPSATAHTPHRSTCTRRNSSSAIGDPSAFERQVARFDELGIAYPFGGPRNARDRRRKEKEETEVPSYRRIHGKASRDDRTAAARIRSGARGRQLREARRTCSSARIPTETHLDQDRAFSAMVRALGSVCEARGSCDGVRPSWGRNRDARSVFRGQEWRSRGPISSAAELESFWIHRR